MDSYCSYTSEQVACYNNTCDVTLDVDNRDMKSNFHLYCRLHLIQIQLDHTAPCVRKNCGQLNVVEARKLELNAMELKEEARNYIEPNIVSHFYEYLAQDFSLCFAFNLIAEIVYYYFILIYTCILIFHTYSLKCLNAQWNPPLSYYCRHSRITLNA